MNRNFTAKRTPDAMAKLSHRIFNEPFFWATFQCRMLPLAVVLEIKILFRKII